MTDDEVWDWIARKSGYAEWSARPLHVYPVDDPIEHDLEGTACICGPRVDGGVVIHNSLDGREQHESHGDGIS